MKSRLFIVVGRCAWDEWEVDYPVAPRDHFGGSAGNIATMLSSRSNGPAVLLISDLAEDWRGTVYQSYLVDRGITVRSGGNLLRQTPICRIRPSFSYDWIEGGPVTPIENIVRREVDKHDPCALIVSDMGYASESKRHKREYWLPQLWLRSASAPELEDCLARQWRAIFLNESERDQMLALSRVSIEELSQRYSNTRFICTNQVRPTLVLLNGTTHAYPVVDRRTARVAIGGGDALAAGFVEADCRDLSLEHCVRWGQRLAAEVVDQVGCQLATATVDVIRSGFVPSEG